MSCHYSLPWSAALSELDECYIIINDVNAYIPWHSGIHEIQCMGRPRGTLMRFLWPLSWLVVPAIDWHLLEGQ